MIDCHCHLEQKDYSEDRDKVIEKCKKELKAVITSCTRPSDFKLTLQIVEKHNGFVFCTAGIHPEYMKEIKAKDIEEFLEHTKQARDKIVGIGETGLDYFWIKDSSLQKKQRELFVQLIAFAKELKKPLVIHSRDAFEDTVKILEQEDAKQVYMHMFGGQHLLKRILENGWFIGLNTILLRSKKHKKIARDCPLDKLLLETDAPWLAPLTEPSWKGGKRNDPTAVKIVAEKIAEIKKVPLEKVVVATTANAIRFFSLPL